MIYEKECPICGAFFTTKTKIRKYCDKCIDQSGHKAEKANRELARSKREHDPAKVITYKCELCGREHTIETKYLSKVKICGSSRSSWDGEDHYYCCSEHADQARHDHATCGNCGKLLKGCDYSYSPYREFNYCCKECEEEHKLSIKKIYKHLCINCGKEFTRNVAKAYFCSRECSNEARKAGWISPESRSKKVQELLRQVQVKYKCDNCNKIFYKTYSNDADAYIDSANHHFCKKACRDAYLDKVCKAAKAEKQKAKEAALQKKSQRKDNEPLCTTCKVSYKNCERMQSNFTILPRGAHYNSNGIVVECPKYRR